uniref:Putative gamma-secretase subunit aph-1 n=1 Tax=Anopheles triannulatus TaxID=58253 RepID=A0A2M4APZ4_9DIPT
MTLAEFYGCSFLAFGPPAAMFALTIAHDPIRIIILIAASFFWLVSLLLSSIVWFATYPFDSRQILALLCSVLIQETFRFLMYKVLRKTENGLQEVTDIVRIADYRHILSYATGLGFGIISGAFSLVNILADSVGPATVGLRAGSDVFMLVSAAQSLAMILLHTFWGVIFFHSLDVKNYKYTAYVVASHLFVSAITLLNALQQFAVTLTISYLVLAVTTVMAFHVVGGTLASFQKFITCK